MARKGPPPDPHAPIPIGRPSKLTAERQQLLAGLLGAGVSSAEAAKAAGISSASLRNWLTWGEDEPDGLYGGFVLAVREAEQEQQPNPEQRPATKDELNDWFASHLGVRLPATAVCPGHDAPLDVAWDLFTNAVDEALILGSRSGGKTLFLAMLHAANGYWKPGHSTTHYGSVERQAKRAYKHFQGFLRRPEIRGQIRETGATTTSWRNGSEVEILPGTVVQTQGPHSWVVSWDELESGARQPYENARGIPIEDDAGNPGQFITTSTRQKRGGLMQQALDDAPARGARIYTWCVWETITPSKIPARCRHTEEQHRDRERPAAFACTQPLHKYTRGLRLDRATGWRSLRDVMATFRRMAQDTFETQVLNLRPDAGALIYPTFTAEANVTEAAEYVPGQGVLWGYDSGFNHPTWLGFFQLRGGAFWLFDEISGMHRSERHWIREGIKRTLLLPDYEGPTLDEWAEYWEGRHKAPTRWPRVWPHATGDTTAGHFGFELKEHGVGRSPNKKVRHDVEVGQAVLRAAFSAAGTIRFWVHPRCRVFIECAQAYMAQELPDGTYGELPDPSPANHAFSHPLDGSRYLVYRYRRELGIAGGGGDEE
ncbi:MAG: hypothetical protein Q8Q14_12020 [Gemmatimonadales bacterium]|nr:hypothetical protein [Gemmatimonadales bacterium]